MSHVSPGLRERQPKSTGSHGFTVEPVKLELLRMPGECVPVRTESDVHYHVTSGAGVYPGEGGNAATHTV